MVLDAMFDLRASGRILDKYPARVDLLAYLERSLPNEKWTDLPRQGGAPAAARDPALCCGAL